VVRLGEHPQPAKISMLRLSVRGRPALFSHSQDQKSNPSQSDAIQPLLASSSPDEICWCRDFLLGYRIPEQTRDQARDSLALDSGPRLGIESSSPAPMAKSRHGPTLRSQQCFHGAEKATCIMAPDTFRESGVRYHKSDN